MAFDFSDLQAQRFQDDLRAAAGYKPLLKEDLEKAYSRYKDQGVKMGRVKGKSDAALYKMATQDVLAWWKAQKAKPNPSGSAPQTPSNPAPSAGGGGSSGGSSSSGGSYSSGTRSGGAMLPDTAVGTGGNAIKMVPITYVEQQLARYGFGGAKVPEYARRSKADFDAWLRRAIRLRTQRTYGTPVIVDSTQQSTVARRAPVVN